ncbi:hypothetical protein PR048_002467 [Dryococelus australis]|uniref:Uncharacterized protein n=1 Tax=Dryococelus australis TaxID=614101 RepID=A0ABQ9IK92_9NEOP|nr:hypothetical protein PR048_002467 [Dryococelus australis]
MWRLTTTKTVRCMFRVQVQTAKMSSRPILSRPRRTKVYDCNYDMGERYYRPVVDGLDRKYTGGRLSTPPVDSDLLQSTLPRRPLLLEEHEDSLPRSRRPASALLNEYDAIFDSRGRALGSGGPPTSRQWEDDADQEFTASLKRIKDSRAASRASFREEVESVSRRADTFSDKLLGSMGLKTPASSGTLDDDPFFKRRTLKVATSEELDDPSLTKWTALKSGARREVDTELAGAAQARASKSRARLADLDAEMEDMAQRSAAREKRAANLRALMAEAEAIGSDQETSSIRVRAVKTEKKVTF